MQLTALRAAADAERSACNARSLYAPAMNLSLEREREADGRWSAEVPELPGVLAYGASCAEALAKAEAVARRVLAGRIEYGEASPTAVSICLSTAALVVDYPFGRESCFKRGVGNGKSAVGRF